MSNAEENTAESAQSLRLFASLDDIFPKVNTAKCDALKPAANVTFSSRLLMAQPSLSANFSVFSALVVCSAIASRMSQSLTFGTNIQLDAKQLHSIPCEQ